MATQQCFCPAACGLAHPRDWCGRRESIGFSEEEKRAAFRLMAGHFSYRRANRKAALSELIKFEKNSYETNCLLTGRQTQKQASQRAILRELARFERLRFEMSYPRGKRDVSRIR